MIRSSSLEAYTYLQACGEINRQELVIIKTLLNSGQRDLTRKQIARLSGLETSSVSGRVNRLIKNGFITENKKRVCPVSGMTVSPVALVEREPQQLQMAV